MVIRRSDGSGGKDSGIGLIILHMNGAEIKRLEDHLKKYES